MLLLVVLLLATACVHSFLTATKKASVTALFNAKTPLVANGKRVEADPGSSLIAACTKLGLKVPTKCKKGECGTCTVTVAGSKYRACIAKVPPGIIMYFIIILLLILSSPKVEIFVRKRIGGIC